MELCLQILLNTTTCVRDAFYKWNYTVSVEELLPSVRGIIFACLLRSRLWESPKLSMKEKIVVSFSTGYRNLAEKRETTRKGYSCYGSELW